MVTYDDDRRRTPARHPHRQPDLTGPPDRGVPGVARARHTKDDHPRAARTSRPYGHDNRSPLTLEGPVPTSRRTRSRTRKVLLSLAAVSTAAAIAGLGTYATFTSTTSASQQISSGTVAITLGSAGSAQNRLTIGATGVVPGDTVQRRVILTNASGNENLASITLTTTATTSTALNTDGTDGLHMTIQKCGGGLGWTEAGPPYTYTCDAAIAGDNAGTRSTVLARRAIIGSSLALTGMSALTSNRSDDMVVTVDLPASAPNSMQTLSSTIQYSFLGTQRAATNK
ncbi:MAG: TasA family protein [Acidimicrobiales bacterium]